jgi:hypothetical protein
MLDPAFLFTMIRNNLKFPRTWTVMDKIYVTAYLTLCLPLSPTACAKAQRAFNYMALS